MSNDRVKESPAEFRAAAPWPMPSETNSATGIYRAKVFKSGNSLALRLPAALGLEAGTEMDLRVASDGTYALSRIDAPRPKVDISGFWGKAKGIKLAPRENFEERPSTIAAREAARKAAGLA